MPQKSRILETEHEGINRFSSRHGPQLLPCQSTGLEEFDTRIFRRHALVGNAGTVGLLEILRGEKMHVSALCGHLHLAAVQTPRYARSSVAPGFRGGGGSFCHL